MKQANYVGLQYLVYENIKLYDKAKSITGTSLKPEHTGNLRNIENVWKAEKKHDAEQKKLEELCKQI
ncbi:hypothetical protein RJ639_009381 [Escallonia herrerae]|uniref:CBF1-interacting co-repressor CIR N-terminal domain-containing protein n=1 Tax=Escallonia herrerae TaxID=1293975 RepID=A0AA88VU03_9ASTE|nr:hypothetical protein RJ639_009381 [Escallonia herrerae]